MGPGDGDRGPGGPGGGATTSSVGSPTTNHPSRSVVALEATGERTDSPVDGGEWREALHTHPRVIFV